MKKQIFYSAVLAVIGLSVKARTAYITKYGANTISIINVATNTVFENYC